MDEQPINQNQEQQEQEVAQATQSQSDQGVTDLAAKCEEYLAGWKRAQADYLNLQRESERAKLESSKYANERLLSALLPAIDQFEMALAFTPDLSAVPEADRKKLENWIVGLKAVRSGWETAFKEIGLEQVSTVGTFDPFMHEAVGEEESAERKSGEIVRCMQVGWRLNGKLLRPAKVTVAK